MMKTVLLAVGLIALHVDPAGAGVLPPRDEYSVGVTVSAALQRRMASIDALEQRFEERFRSNRSAGGAIPEAGTQRFAEIVTAGTRWAGVRLIDSPSAYTLENLVRAMVAYNVNRAAPGFRGRIDVHVETLQLGNPALAWLGGIRSHADGRIRVTLPDGTVAADEEVAAILVSRPTVDTAYDGPELAFIETDTDTRIGPTLAAFVQRALRSVWPDRADAVVGPVIVRISGPGARLIQGRTAPTAGIDPRRQSTSSSRKES